MFHIRLAHRMRGKLSADPGSHLIVDATNASLSQGCRASTRKSRMSRTTRREIGRNTHFKTIRYPPPAQKIDQRQRTLIIPVQNPHLRPDALPQQRFVPDAQYFQARLPYPFPPLPQS